MIKKKNNDDNLSLISIIVPVYNVSNYLDNCIKSIINQTYKNIEIILVDDGSTDDSSNICDKYLKKDKRIKVIHKSNGGLSSARNIGIVNSNGEYITFIDSDDYVEKEYVEVLYKNIIKYSSDISIGSHKVIYESGKIIYKSNNLEYSCTPKETLKNMLYDNGIDVSAWAKLYKRELFKSIRYPEGRLFEDAATTYKLIDKSKKISVNLKPIYNYTIRKDSITGESFTLKKLDLIKSTIEMCNYIKKKYPDLISACDRRLMYAHLITLSQVSISKEKYTDIRKELMLYIKKNRIKVLKDKNIKKIDRFGLLCTFLGYGFYKLCWRIYKLKKINF